MTQGSPSKVGVSILMKFYNNGGKRSLRLYEYLQFIEQKPLVLV